MAEKIDKDMEKKIKDLKIELLKQAQKRKSIKREIARLLTKNKMEKLKTKSGGKN